MPAYIAQTLSIGAPIAAGVAGYFIVYWNNSKSEKPS
jgi:hypothetical protein